MTVPEGMEVPWVENWVRTYIIKNWEAQDEPEHLRTIRDRLEQNPQLIGRILGIYQQILQGKLPKIFRCAGGRDRGRRKTRRIRPWR